MTVEHEFQTNDHFTNSLNWLYNCSVTCKWSFSSLSILHRSNRYHCCTVHRTPITPLDLFLRCSEYTPITLSDPFLRYAQMIIFLYCPSYRCIWWTMNRSNRYHCCTVFTVRLYSFRFFSSLFRVYAYHSIRSFSSIRANDHFSLLSIIPMYMMDNESLQQISLLHCIDRSSIIL